MMDRYDKIIKKEKEKIKNREYFLRKVMAREKAIKHIKKKGLKNNKQMVRDYTHKFLYGWEPHKDKKSYTKQYYRNYMKNYWKKQFVDNVKEAYIYDKKHNR